MEIPDKMWCRADRSRLFGGIEGATKQPGAVAVQSREYPADERPVQCCAGFRRRRAMNLSVAFGRAGASGRQARALCAVAVLLVPLLAASLFAQTTNPSYIAEFPSVDKVLTGEKAADADTTAAQQMAAFTWLMDMIVQMAGPRQFTTGFTPDENKLRQAYNTALTNIQKSNPKYAPGTAMRQLQFSLPFRNQMIQQLFPPGFQADFSKVVGQTKQQAAQLHQQAVAKSQAQEAANRPAEQQAIQQLQQQLQEANMDPATREMRRCVTSGRVLAVCTGNALSSSLLGGVNQLLSAAAPGMVGKEVTGPQMAGVFNGPGGWHLEFSEASVTVACQDLIGESHAYTVSFANNRAVLDIANMPNDVVLTVSGNTLAGAGPMTVSGRVPNGVSERVNGAKATTVYKYLEVTRNCVKPALSASNSPGVVGAEQNLLVSMFNDGQSGPPTPPGLRMNGSYAAASTGFSVEFFPESVILGCGPDVARAYPYTVVADGKQTAIQVAAPDHPLTLAWKGNNVLDPGTGPYVVAGRTITGQASNGDYTFAPRNATCNLAALTPGPIPSMLPSQPAAPAGPMSPDPFAALSNVAIPSAASGSAILSILSGLPAVPNPLGGRRYVLLRDDVNNIIAKSGAAMAPAVSPVTTMGNDCAKSTPDCQKILNAVKAASVSAVVANAPGMAVLSGVPPGTYYLVVSAPYNGQMLHWDLKVALQAGRNAVTLTTQNAAP